MCKSQQGTFNDDLEKICQNSKLYDIPYPEFIMAPSFYNNSNLPNSNAELHIGTNKPLHEAHKYNESTENSNHEPTTCRRTHKNGS